MDSKEVIKKVIKELLDSIEITEYGYNVKPTKIFDISTFIEKNTTLARGSHYQNVGKFIFDNSDIFLMYGFTYAIPNYMIWYNNKPVYSMDKL